MVYNKLQSDLMKTYISHGYNPGYNSVYQRVVAVARIYGVSYLTWPFDPQKLDC